MGVTMKKGAILLLILLMLYSCQNNIRQRPKLIVYVSVDQMRADYISDSLYGPYLSSKGFHYLKQHGISFENCFHDHACTMTGPGHTTLGSGAYAYKTGIVGNEFWDSKAMKFNYCVYDSTVHPVDGDVIKQLVGSSIHYSRISSLGDELKKQDAKSKVFGISLKDRAAILMSGKHPDGVYWYNSRNGHFISSSYYTNYLPRWISEMNQENITFFRQILKKGWMRIKDAKVYEEKLGPDTREGEGNRNGMGISFPHMVSQQTDSLDRRFFSNIRFTPFGDELLEHVAKKLIMQEKLGRDEHTDLLCVSFSATDYIGHTYGPFSHEMMDQIIRLDSLIADFRQFLDQTIGVGQYVLAISADHGVAPLPEYSLQQGRSAGRIHAKEVNMAISEIFRQFDAGKGGQSTSYIRKITSNYVYLTDEGREIYMKHREQIDRQLKKIPEKVEGIRNIFSKEEILSSTHRDKIFRRIQHAYYPGRSGDFYILPSPYYFFGYPGSSTGTTHGTPYDYDAHVPFIIYGNGLSHELRKDTVGTADIAVTLGKLAGVDIESGRDGNNVIKSIH
jgi:predicted AlkP superfamily pyrophosphatase or phosphodiesterase